MDGRTGQRDESGWKHFRPLANLSVSICSADAPEIKAGYRLQQVKSDLYGDRMQPDTEAWESWHPRDFAARMEGADFLWFVAGGWAIDLFLGTRTRDHEDLEIAVASSFFETLPPRFPEFDFWIPQGERKLARISSETLAGESYQTWAYERAARVWRFDVFREPHDGHTWICRRDTSIRRRTRKSLRCRRTGSHT